MRAQDSYQRYIDELPDAKNADEVIDKIIDIQGRIAKELARVQVSSDSEGREVFVDAETSARCQTPCMLVLQPGTHTVRVPGPESTQFTRELTLKAGEREELQVTFDLSTAGTLTVTSDAPGAILAIDGRSLALPLATPQELDAGSYPATLSLDGEPRWSGQIRIQKKQETALIIPLAHTQVASTGLPIKRVAAYSLLSAGAGLLIGGAVMGLQARDTYANLDDARTAGASMPPALIDQGKSQQRTANILFLTGGLAAASGGGLLTWDLLGSRAAPRAAPSQPEPAPPKEEDARRAPDAPAAPPVEDVELLD